MKRRIIITATIFGVLAVIAGAFGAHGLQGSLSPRDLDIWHTGVQYQFYHAFALIALSTITRLRTNLIKHIYFLFSVGIVLFSGSLYLLACKDLLNWSWIALVMGPVTPIGGLLFIAGWITLGVAALKIR
jgi:uncharacterized membrane protein YgdD (TMEM256/DUF423 family)